jgi:hypothetical protein
MILLDENIRQDQGERLRKWRIHFRFLIEGPAHPGVFPFRQTLLVSLFAS